jgi:hypothetical protein
MSEFPSKTKVRKILLLYEIIDYLIEKIAIFNQSVFMTKDASRYLFIIVGFFVQIGIPTIQDCKKKIKIADS